MKKILFISLLFLTACSHNNSFQCPAVNGVGCESVTTVNNLINNDSLDEYIAFKADPKACKNCKKDHLKQPEQIVVHFESYVDDVGIKHPAHDVYLNERTL